MTQVSCPYKDKQFDIALSMENLEHLYSTQSISAIREMTRIENYVIITTPVPPECVCDGNVYLELIEAINDAVPLTERDFTCLESAIHKSTIFPISMDKAGFSVESNSHGLYFGSSKNIKIELIECVGMEPVDIGLHKAKIVFNSDFDYKWVYVNTLAKSPMLKETIKSHPLYRATPFGPRLVRKIRSILYNAYPYFLNNRITKRS